MQTFAKTGLVLLFVFQTFCGPSSTLLADDAPEVASIANTAINAQNAGDFELAAIQWEKLIAEHPDSTQIGTARYHAGFCHVQLGHFAKAADHLEQSIGKLDPSRSVSVAQAYLFLGFSQMKLGHELSDENSAESKQLLTSATQSFLTLLKNHPDFDDADQALFFQGESFEALERLDEAASAYSKMLTYTDAEFKLDGLFALAYIKSQQGKYDEAYDLYTKFESEGAKHNAINEVKFRAAETIVELAKAAENLGEQTRANGLLEKAAEKFGTVYETRDTSWADQARFEQANCKHQLGDFATSATLYESVVQIVKSDLADQARVYAGRDYLRAGDGNAASQLLEKAVAVPSKYAAEGAHWLSQLYLRANQNDKAYGLASQWIEKSEEPAVKIRLMMDQADAAYALNNRRQESKTLYLKIADTYPDHRLAATSLYNAAFAAMKSDNFTNAIELSNRFRKRYSDSDYLPDMLEVEADSLLLSEKPAAAEATFGELIAKFPKHPKAQQWQMRQGLALYLQKKYDATINKLNPIIAALQNPEDKAEALHWVGSSQFQNGQPNEAIVSLQESFATSSQWRRADETLLTLSRAFYQAKDPAKAKKTTEQLISTFPKSQLIGEASYRLGEFEFDAGNFQAAMKNYANVVENFEDSHFAPYAMYGIGWSHLQLNEFQQAADAFTKLVDVVPNHALASEVLVGRASALRQLGKTDLAIADIENYLAKDATQSKKEEALYELGLAQIAQQKWTDVTKTFTQLIDFAPNSKLADRYNYELAWAYKSNKDAANGLKHFGMIADNWPNSSLAAESSFHVAQDAYTRKDYGLAVKKFESCLERCANLPADERANIQEKATYKLAWSHYKQKEYDNALNAFRKQINDFPNGKLNADAMFMVSESLYENDKFKEALQEYRVAKPVIETSKTVSPNFKILTFLHGAQSANQAGEHQMAIEFAESLLGMDVNKNIKQDAQMEIGDAYRALKDPQKAVAAYEQAALHPGKTGARSMCMVGEVLLDEKNYAEAINKFKLVWYGYGGTKSADDVKPWQSVAVFEAARCNLLQASANSDNLAVKTKFVGEAKKQFQYLVDHFPSDKLAPKAKQQLQNFEGNN